MNNDEIEITKGAEYLRTAAELSAVIAALPLTTAQNNELVQCIMKHTAAGRSEAFAQGLMFGITGNQDQPRQIRQRYPRC